MSDHPFEPYKIKTIEPLHLSTRDQRVKWAKQIHYNLFALKAQQVLIDLLTDSGTSAMSQHQWAGLLEGDESYAGALSFQRFEKAVKQVTGFRQVIPTHQGRSAENLLFSVTVKKGDLVPNNTHFDTTGANIRYQGGVPVSLPCRQSLDPDSPYPFKGNMDAVALNKLLAAKKRIVPLVMITCTNNSVGGQPVSLENLTKVAAICRAHKVPLVIDGCRFAENAWFIKQRERGCKNKSITQIAREMLTLADGMTMSAKKDALVNIGGFFATNKTAWANRIREIMVVIEGFPTYGGMAGRDMEAMARGLEEGLGEDYLTARIGQVAYLGQKLTEAGVPAIKPYGGHAIFVNARRFCDHIPQSQFPGQALAVALYIEAGIRTVEIGSVMFAEKDPKTGKVVYPKMELVRLAIPRRVYTASHLDYIASSLTTLYRKRKKIRGIKIVYNPPTLRHFLARYDYY